MDSATDVYILGKDPTLSWNAYNYRCTDLAGNVIHKVRNHPLGTKLSLIDAAGQPSGMVRRKFWTFNCEFYDGSGRLIGKATRNYPTYKISDYQGMVLATANKMPPVRPLSMMPAPGKLEYDIVDPSNASQIAKVTKYYPEGKSIGVSHKLEVFRSNFPKLLLIEFTLAAVTVMGIDFMSQRGEYDGY